MAIFLFFKMVAAAILEVRNFKIVMVEKFQRAKLSHCAKFRADRSNRCGGMTIFYRATQLCQRGLGSCNSVRPSVRPSVRLSHACFETQLSDDGTENVDVFRSIHETQLVLPPPAKIPTPYGGQLTWTLPGGNLLYVHIKDKNKIRHKKRWSQVTGIVLKHLFTLLEVVCLGMIGLRSYVNRNIGDKLVATPNVQLTGCSNKKTPALYCYYLCDD